MKLFADTPVRRTVQVLADLLFVAWLVLRVRIGMAVHDGTMELAGPARQTDSAATSMAEQLRDADGRLGEAPLVGDELSVPFDKAADASDGIASAGRDTVAAVERLALLLGLSVALIPILVVAVLHLPLRWRFVREATAAARFIDAQEDLDLFALRPKNMPGQAAPPGRRSSTLARSGHRAREARWPALAMRRDAHHGHAGRVAPPGSDVET